MKQESFFKNQSHAHGGELYRKRKGRGPRPLDTKNTIHLILRSSQAIDDLSFLKPKNKTVIEHYIQKFARRFSIQVIGLANVGNHIHLHIKLSNRFTYKPFIRALTSAIVTGIKKLNRSTNIVGKFFDLRPFTRVTQGRKDFVGVCQYIEINILEAQGFMRSVAEALIKSTFKFKRSG